jgi:hypothetical protein
VQQQERRPTRLGGGFKNVWVGEVLHGAEFVRRVEPKMVSVSSANARGGVRGRSAWLSAPRRSW